MTQAYRPQIAQAAAPGSHRLRPCSICGKPTRGYGQLKDLCWSHHVKEPWSPVRPIGRRELYEEGTQRTEHQKAVSRGLKAWHARRKGGP